MKLSQALESVSRFLRHRQGRMLAYALPALLLVSIVRMGRTFGNPTADQILFHLQLAPELSEGLPLTLVLQGVLAILFWSPLLALLAATVESICWPAGTGPRRARPAIGRWPLLAGPCLMMALSLVLAVSQFQVLDLVFRKTNEDFVRTHYLDPRTVTISAQRPRNLILIYLESFEAAYADQNLFGRNLVQPLQAQGGFQIENFTQVEGTGWTIAALVSSQCALPLRSVGIANGNLQGEIVRHFLPSVECLGDTLKKLGYENVFLGGASLAFSGKGKFLSTHGYSRMMGREEWLATGRYSKRDFNEWGLHDDDLMAEAKRELERLHGTGKPFNLTMLTVDSHFPKGHLSRSCQRKGGRQFEEVIECTADRVADFLNFARRKGFLENTQVVMVGDHLTMPNPVFAKLTSVKERRIFNQWIGNLAMPPHAAAIAHFDLAPSILEFMGIAVPDGRYGLGISAFSPQSQAQGPHRLETLKARMTEPSDFYKRLWLRRS